MAERVVELARAGVEKVLALQVDAALEPQFASEPFAVDVASGTERSPGVKDPDKLLAFYEAVHGEPLAPAVEPEAPAQSTPRDPERVIDSASEVSSPGVVG